MALTKAQKKDVLEKLQGLTDKSSVVFVNFKGLKSDDTVALRKQLRENGVTYLVAKKSLLQKAFGESKIAGTLPEMSGELALVYGDDPTAPAREIFGFQNKFKGNISIVGGTFENAYLDKAGMEAIALIPSLNTLRGMFVNVINSPIQGLVVGLQAIADKKPA